MRKVLVVTGTRSEYGLLYWTMKKIDRDNELELQLVVTGNHLLKEYGYTIEEIKRDGFKIDEEIDMIIDSHKKSSVVKSMGIEMIQIAQCFDRLNPDILLVLGDRYETFVAVTCAMMMNIPIAHMNGGESTEGAVDEQIRHAITKMAHIHLVGAEYYKERVIKMGEETWRVHNVGQAGIENIKKINLLSKNDLQKELKFDIQKPIFLITYHPVTLELDSIEEQVDNLLDSIKEFDANFLFTYPNADFGSKVVISKISNFVDNCKNAYLFYSLGQRRYLSLLNNSDVLIGNSSSGIIEAPSFMTPVINIGTRQKGRLRSNNIIDVGYSKKDIIDGINKALYDGSFKDFLNDNINIYGDGDVSTKIIEILKSVKLESLLLKKLTY